MSNQSKFSKNRSGIKKEDNEEPTKSKDSSMRKKFDFKRSVQRIKEKNELEKSPFNSSLRNFSEHREKLMSMKFKFRPS